MERRLFFHDDGSNSWPRMYKELVALEVDPSLHIKGCTTVATALAATMQCYAERPCIGYPVPFTQKRNHKVPRPSIHPALPTEGQGQVDHKCNHIDITWTCSECAADEERSRSDGEYRRKAIRPLHVAAKAAKTSQTLIRPIEDTLSTEAASHKTNDIDYEWLSYSQVFETSQNFGTGLRKIVHHRREARRPPAAADDGAGPAIESSSAPSTQQNGGGPSRSENGEINVSISFTADDIYAATYTLKVLIKEARGLRALDANGRSDPFVKVSVGSNKVEKTPVIKKTLSPKWDKEYTFRGITDMEARGQQLEIAVWDWDRITSNDLIGRQKWNLEDLVDTTIENQWFPLLKDRQGKRKQRRGSTSASFNHAYAIIDSQSSLEEEFKKATIDIGYDIRSRDPVVVIYAEASPDWYIAQYGCLLAECVVVPVSVETSEDHLAEIIAQCNPVVFITSVGMQDVGKRLLARPGTSTSDIRVITIAGAGENSFNDSNDRNSGTSSDGSKTKVWDADSEKGSFLSLADVVKIGVRVDAMKSSSPSGGRRPSLRRSLRSFVTNSGSEIKVKGTNFEPRMLIPTSGSSGGMPKLITVTDEMIVRQFAVPPFGGQTVLYSFQPIRQTFGTLIKGGRIGLSSGNGDRLHHEMAVLRPTHVGSTPVFWQAQLQQFNALIKLAEKESSPTSSPGKSSSSTNSASIERDRHTTLATAVRGQLVKRWREKRLLGNRCRTVLLGGSSSSPELKAFISEVFGVSIVDGYGISETGSIASNAEVTGNSALQLVDAPELGYLTTDVPYARGEIVANTDRLTPGYYNDLAANEDAFVMIGGKRHFRTGDMGVLLDGKINVVAKKTAMFKLSNGIFVAPALLESMYEESTLISQCIVYPNAGAHGIRIGVVLSDEGKKRMPPNGTTRKIDADIFSECARLANEKNRKPYEIPREAVLLTDPWTLENGLLHSNFKIRRPNVLKVLGNGVLLTPSAKLKSPNATAAATSKPTRFQLAAGLEHVLRSHIPALEGDTPLPTSEHTIYDLGANSLILAALQSALMGRFGIRIPLSRLASSSIWNLQAGVLGGGVESMPFMEGSEEELIGEVSRAQDSLADFVMHNPRDRRDRGFINPADLKAANRLSIHWYNNARSTGVVSGHIFSAKKAVEADTVVLLTGATGYVGAFLLNEIIQHDSEVHVICLTRADSNEAAALRVSNTLAYYDLHCTSRQWSAMAGDLTKKDFGLSQEAYDHLESNLHEVYHAGAIVNAALPFSAIRGANVDGTRRVVELCVKADISMHYISAIAVLANTGITSEVLEVPVPRVKASAFAKSKWVAEQIVIDAAADFNLKARIYRLGTMAAHSVSGACNPNDIFTRMVDGILHMGSYPIVNGTTDSHFPVGFYLTPIDWAVRAIYSIASLPFRRHRDDGRMVADAVHITSNCMTRFTTAIEAIDEMHKTHTVSANQNDVLSGSSKLGRWSSLDSGKIEVYSRSLSGKPRFEAADSAADARASSSATPVSPSRRSSNGLGRWQAIKVPAAQRPLSSRLGDPSKQPNRRHSARGVDAADLICQDQQASSPQFAGARKERGASSRISLWKAVVPLTPREFDVQLCKISVDNPLFPFRDTLRLKRHALSVKRPTIKMAQTLEHIAPCPLVCKDELVTMLKFLGTKSNTTYPSAIGPPVLDLKQLIRSSVTSASLDDFESLIESDEDSGKGGGDDDSAAGPFVKYGYRRASGRASMSTDFPVLQELLDEDKQDALDASLGIVASNDGEQEPFESLYFPPARSDAAVAALPPRLVHVAAAAAAAAAAEVAEDTMGLRNISDTRYADGDDAELAGLGIQRTLSYKAAVTFAATHTVR